MVVDFEKRAFHIPWSSIWNVAKPFVEGGTDHILGKFDGSGEQSQQQGLQQGRGQKRGSTDDIIVDFDKRAIAVPTKPYRSDDPFNRTFRIGTTNLQGSGILTQNRMPVNNGIPVSKPLGEESEQEPESQPQAEAPEYLSQ